MIRLLPRTPSVVDAPLWQGVPGAEVDPYRANQQQTERAWTANERLKFPDELAQPRRTFLNMLPGEGQPPPQSTRLWILFP